MARAPARARAITRDRPTRVGHHATRATKGVAAPRTTRAHHRTRAPPLRTRAAATTGAVRGEASDARKRAAARSATTAGAATASTRRGSNAASRWTARNVVALGELSALVLAAYVVQTCGWVIKEINAIP